MKHIVVVKTNNPKPHPSQSLRAFGVCLLLLLSIMITSINLYDELLVQTYEICDIIAYDMLAIEFYPQLVVPNVVPEIGLSLRRELPMLLGQFFQYGIPVWRSCPIILVTHLYVRMFSPPSGGEWGWGFFFSKVLLGIHRVPPCGVVLEPALKPSVNGVLPLDATRVGEDVMVFALDGHEGRGPT